MPKRNRTADADPVASSTEVGSEPSNADLASGAWPRLPAPTNSVTVTVPHGVFAQLKQARETYPELSKADVEAFDAIRDFTASASDFAKNGDMPPETAERLAFAEASKVFAEITVRVMPSHLHGVVSDAIIGTIETTGGTRYFLIDRQDRVVATILDRVRTEDRRKRLKEWWSDFDNVFGVVMGSTIAVGAITPIVLALVFWNAEFLYLWTAGLILVLIVGAILDSL